MEDATKEAEKDDEYSNSISEERKSEEIEEKRQKIEDKVEGRDPKKIKERQTKKIKYLICCNCLRKFYNCINLGNIWYVRNLKILYRPIRLVLLPNSLPACMIEIGGPIYKLYVGQAWFPVVYSPRQTRVPGLHIYLIGR